MTHDQRRYYFSTLVPGYAKLCADRGHREFECLKFTHEFLKYRFNEHKSTGRLSTEQSTEYFELICLEAAEQGVFIAFPSTVAPNYFTQQNP